MVDSMTFFYPFYFIKDIFKGTCRPLRNPGLRRAALPTIKRIFKGA